MKKRPSILESDAAAPPQPDRSPGEVWAEHRPWLGACLLAHKPAGVEIDDLLQEVAVRVMQNLHTLENPNRLRPWLRQIALNAARDAARRGNLRRTEGLPDHEFLADDKPSALEERIERGDQRSRVARVLKLARQLPPELSEPLLLRGVRGLSQVQIAETLEISESSVESRLARARRKLSDRLHVASRSHSDPVAGPIYPINGQAIS